jgi:hypothetical protein
MHTVGLGNEVESIMKGVIGSRETLANLPLIWREFGPGCAVRCLHALLLGKKTTFLEMTTRPDPTPEAEPQKP